MICCQLRNKKMKKHSRLEWLQLIITFSVARFAILSALNRLDPDRRSFLIHLLYEARLITHPTVISLQSANLTDINLNTVSHSKTLHYVSFQDALMTRAIFHSMNIHGVTFNRALLDNANFSLSTNSWECEREDCKQKLNFQNSNLQSTSFIFVNLLEANFGRSKIGPNVNFYNADMRRINAEYINLKNCQFRNTNLSESIFDHAIIINSSFKQSQMIKISMKFSEINNTEFSIF